jgi:hypothetical protein
MFKRKNNVKGGQIKMKITLLIIVIAMMTFLIGVASATITITPGQCYNVTINDSVVETVCANLTSINVCQVYQTMGLYENLTLYNEACDLKISCELGNESYGYPILIDVIADEHYIYVSYGEHHARQFNRDVSSFSYQIVDTINCPKSTRPDSEWVYAQCREYFEETGAGLPEIQLLNTLGILADLNNQTFITALTSGIAFANCDNDLSDCQEERDDCNVNSEVYEKESSARGTWNWIFGLTLSGLVVIIVIKGMLKWSAMRGQASLKF